MKTGVDLIADERKRQIEEKGWTLEHDVNTHTDKALAVQAAICACDGTGSHVETLQMDWSLVQKYGVDGKDPNRVHLLAIAGALIAAEIDRLRNG